MNERPLQNLLQDIAEDAIPPAEVDLWPGIRARTSEITLAGDSRMKPRLQPRQIAVLVTIIVVLLLTTSLLTPQGRTWAQNALQLFIQLDHITSIAEAETLVGYSITSLDPIPSGYIFSHASIHQPSHSVCLHYRYTSNDGPGPYLLVAQGPENMAPSLGVSPDLVAIDEPRAALVGGAQQAYYLHGTGMIRSKPWACTDAAQQTRAAESHSEWITPVLTWQMDQRQFDLYTPHPFGKCFFAEAFSELDLLRLAENLTGVHTYPAEEFDPDCTQDIATLEELVGFDIKIPIKMPADLTLRGIQQSDPGVILSYGFPGDNHAAVFIHQTPIINSGDIDLLELVKSASYTDQDFPLEGYEMLEVNGVPAVIILGTWVDDDGETVWFQEPFFAQTLWWAEDGFLFSIGSTLWSAEDGDAAHSNLIAIAESLR